MSCPHHIPLIEATEKSEEKEGEAVLETEGKEDIRGTRPSKTTELSSELRGWRNNYRVNVGLHQVL